METNVEIRIGTASHDMNHQKTSSGGVRVDMKGIVTFNERNPEDINLDRSSDYSTFISNYKCWSKENFLAPVTNLESCYYREIVKMGVRAVPFIYEELKKGPTDLVYALDEIFDIHINDGTFVPLQETCNLWISILQETELR